VGIKGELTHIKTSRGLLARLMPVSAVSLARVNGPERIRCSRHYL